MSDNKTSQPAQEYDGNIRKTMPYYDSFHDAVLTLAEVACPEPAAWLDAGGGTGSLVVLAAAAFPQTRFTLSDPSAGMVELAREKLAGTVDCDYAVAGTEALEFPAESFDIVTAVLAHHYLEPAARRRATENCFRMLKKNGIYVEKNVEDSSKPEGK